MLRSVGRRPFHIRHVLLRLCRTKVLPHRGTVVLNDFDNDAPGSCSTNCGLRSICTFLHSHLSVPLVANLSFNRRRHAIALPLNTRTVLGGAQRNARLAVDNRPILGVWGGRTSKLDGALSLPLV